MGNLFSLTQRVKPRKHRGEVIQFAALAGGETRLEGLTFTDCWIRGPAVLAPNDECEFRDPVFYGTLEEIIWERPEGSGAIGAIHLHNCVFIDCTFANIGLAGTPKFAALAREAAAKAQSKGPP
jgi:hypothetical protein